MLVLILHFFWTTWGISVKFSENVWLIMILKVKRKQGFTLYLEDKFFEKREGGGQIESLQAVLALMWALQRSTNLNYD